MSAPAAKKMGPRLIHGDFVKDADLDRPLPNNIEAERCLLGCIILDDTKLKATDRLDPGDFFSDQHRLLFCAMLDLQEAGETINSVTLYEQLSASGKLEAAGGLYLSTLADGILPLEFDRYVWTVREKSNLRKIAKLGNAITARALDADAKSETLSLTVIDSLNDISAPMRVQKNILEIPDMPEAVLDGFLGDVALKRFAGFPLAYAWPAIIVVAGTLVPPSAVRTNLYGCLVGEVGSAKTQTIVQVINAFGVVPPQLENTLAGSAEGLSEKLSNADGDARLLNPDELGHMLTKARIDGAVFPYVLQSAYNRSEFDITMARGKKIYLNVRLGIIGGVVEEDFQHCFGAVTTMGLHDRFIFGRGPKPFDFRYRPFEGGREDMEPCAMTVARTVWEAVDEWRNSNPEVNSRIIENAVRVAVIAAAFSGRSILEPKHLGPARAFAEYQARVRALLRPNPGENTDARCAFAILAALDQTSGWNLKRDVARKIHADRFGPSAFERAIWALEAAGDIRIDRAKPVKVRRV